MMNHYGHNLRDVEGGREDGGGVLGVSEGEWGDREG
eukprot:CAMPEP_0172488208 /NCGR_PEP_ID=MMETSP1066-20121228/17630_1 /TAXON_ID=671091 /ORGANISM="Coscinodiscus wailesii, Strain CCMP2513" /LENGTH=35 /DNA_ID= /DNA_START= /DNA_END= /DNA_ORIENTATION=